MLPLVVVRSLSDLRGVSTNTSQKSLSPTLSRARRPRPVWRDERHKDDEAGVSHQGSNLRNAAQQVFDPVSSGEPEIAVEPVAEVVTIEQIVWRPGAELALEYVGDRRLAGARNR